MTTPTPRTDVGTITERQHALLHALNQTHPYTGDGIPDPDGRDRCNQPNCGLPDTHPIHTLREDR